MKWFVNIQNDVNSFIFLMFELQTAESLPSCYFHCSVTTWSENDENSFLRLLFSFIPFFHLFVVFQPKTFIYTFLLSLRYIYSFSLLVPLTLISWSVSFCLFPPSITEMLSFLTPQVVGWRETCRHRNDVGLGRADAALQTLHDLQIVLTKGNKHTHGK